MDSVCDGAGNTAGPTARHRCNRCGELKANTQFRIRAGRRNLYCNKCRATLNARRSPKLGKSRITGDPVKKLKQKDGKPGHLAACEICCELVVFTTDGFGGQLVALDRTDRSLHAHQPPMTSAEANRQRVAQGLDSSFYPVFQSKISNQKRRR